MKILKIYALKKKNQILFVSNVQHIIVISFKVFIKEKMFANNASYKIKKEIEID